MRAWLSPVDMVGEPVTANDIWGYTSPRGREYAIVGLATGTAFVEITDADNPVTVAFIRGAASLWRDMAVYDEFAYSVNEGGDGVQIIDLRRIDRDCLPARRLQRPTHVGAENGLLAGLGDKDHIGAHGGACVGQCITHPIGPHAHGGQHRRQIALRVVHQRVEQMIDRDGAVAGAQRGYRGLVERPPGRDRQL